MYMYMYCINCIITFTSWCSVFSVATSMKVATEYLHTDQCKEDHHQDSEDAEVEERDDQLHQHLENELDT